MAIDGQDSARAVTVADDKADKLLQIITDMDRELHPHDPLAVRVRLDSALERELGFDSLSRVELLARIERAFGVSLSAQVFASAETPRDLLRAVAGTAAAQARSTSVAPAPVTLGDAAAAPAQAQTLVDVLEWHVTAHPNRPHVYLLSGDDQDEEITYQALFDGAQAVAAGLQASGLELGNTAAIMLPTGRDYLFTFFGILLAGGIPVPIYPPVRMSQIEDHLRRHVGILSNAQVRVLVTVAEARPLARLLKSHVATLRHVTTVAELTAQRELPARPLLKADDIAFLQYTSGSTAAPKGVVLTHHNLLVNIRAMGTVLKVDSTDVFVSWLPMYHDMGLIAAWLGTLYHAFPLVLMSPLHFLTRPARWLWAIHRHRGTLSAGPNFAYELCVRRVDDREIEGLDLQSWRMAANGAESISLKTMRAFTERFARYGFREQAMYPVYGLAETAVGLAFPPIGRKPRIDHIAREPFMREGHAIPAAETTPHGLSFTSCGHVLPGHEIRIVDAAGNEVAERQQGRLEFRGPSATSGYFRDPEATRRLFDGDWLDSGDLAYMADGEIYITGRTKDVIIRGGRNIYPPELEDAISGLPGIRRGCVAVFPATDSTAGTERLVVLAETRETQPQIRQELREQINNTVVDLVGMPPDEVVLAPPHTVLKTSSGKLRRAASRALYERGKLGMRKWDVRWQLARFAWTGLWPQWRRSLRGFSKVCYAVYVWAIFALLGPFTWLLMALSPRQSWAWAIFGAAGRLLGRLTATPLTVEGLHNIPQTGPFVLVANHSSYLDGLVLVAILPRRISSVAKRELGEHFVTRIFLDRLGAEYVERVDMQRSADDARRLVRAVQQGRPVGFFPEGKFIRMPGLLPFRLGAFAAAAEAGAPVVPVTIRGTRAILSAETAFPRRGAINVIVGAPIFPQGQDWSAAIALRNAARTEILDRSGEPDLVRSAPSL